MSRGSKTLFVTDMDGTLLDNSARVPDRAMEILRSLSREGAMVTVATARTPASVVPLLENAEIHIPAIVMTGAAWWHFDTGSYSHVHFIDSTHEDVIDSVFRCHNLHPFVYVLSPDNILDVYHAAPQLTEVENLFYELRCHLCLKRFHLHTAPPAYSAGQRVLHFAMGTEKQIRAAATELEQCGMFNVSCYKDTYTEDTWLLEVFAHGVSKAAAVKELKEYLRAEELTVYGDNLNDLPMMAVADRAVAVENALPAVKEAADAVIGSNVSSAVPRDILRQFRFNGKCMD